MTWDAWRSKALSKLHQIFLNLFRKLMQLKCLNRFVIHGLIKKSVCYPSHLLVLRAHLKPKCSVILNELLCINQRVSGPNSWSHVIFIVFFRFLTKSAGGDVIFVVKKKFRAFWCIICLCSWIRSYLPPKNIDRKPWPYCDIICRLSSLLNILVQNELS